MEHAPENARLARVAVEIGEERRTVVKSVWWGRRIGARV